MLRAVDHHAGLNEVRASQNPQIICKNIRETIITIRETCHLA